MAEGVTSPGAPRRFQFGAGPLRYVRDMASGRDRRWIIQVALPAAGGDETAWYAGYGGLVRYRLTPHRKEAHRFDSYPDAVRTREALLSLGVAGQAEIAEE
jgi:hypothetical protein